MSAARLVTGARKYDLIPAGSSCSSCQWRIQRGLLGHAPFGKKNKFLTKEKIGKHGLPPLFIYLNNSSKYSNVDAH